MFNERDAIQFELDELREQARRDDEFYLSIRKQRAERYDQIMDRLRVIDGRDAQVNKKETPLVTNLRTILEDVPKPAEERPDFMPLSQLVKLEAEQKQETPLEKKVREEKLARPKKRGYVPVERITTKVLEYLEVFKGEQPLRDIQHFVETELGINWVNFSVVMKRAMEINPRIKKADKQGYYYLDL